VWVVGCEVTPRFCFGSERLVHVEWYLCYTCLDSVIVKVQREYVCACASAYPIYDGVVFMVQSGGQQKCASIGQEEDCGALILWVWLLGCWWEATAVTSPAASSDSVVIIAASVIGRCWRS
jgi:hypothetical protein